MSVHIDRVETQMDVLPTGSSASADGLGGLAMNEAALKERLRPIVLQILQEELERLRRKQG